MRKEVKVMEWNTLICDKRVATDKFKEPQEWKDHPIDEFEKDYKNIISNSLSAFGCNTFLV